MYATIIFASLLPALLSVIAWRQPFAWHRSKPQVFASSQNNLIEGEALKRIGKWACVKHCGACCKLGPLSSRPQVREYLNEAEYMQYKSMIGTDNWCKHFDKEQRICTIYESRPNFCNVSKSNVKKMFNIDAEEFAVSRKYL